MSLHSARLGLPLLAAGQAQKEWTHNEALALIDAGIGAAVETVGANTPPASPAVGQCWILGDAPTGAWAGRAQSLSCWTEGGWRFLPPVEGMRAWVKAAGMWAVRTGSAWALGEVTGARLVLGGLQVVGPRGAPVAAPAGGAVVDVEARVALAAIIARLQAHGLVEA